MRALTLSEGLEPTLRVVASEAMAISGQGLGLFFTGCYGQWRSTHTLRSSVDIFGTSIGLGS